ncbi:MAG: hypothetical protein HYZ65_14440 [Burkholderiales bacterium]|nr:hypothetical protein [Burkholderiales bacterium]
MKTRTSYFRIGIESIDLPGKEPMSMVGGSYLLQVAPEIYAGPAAYGALTGKRGGFFTGGGELAWRKPLLTNLVLETGMYVGGGGGGTALVGGGLMLRPHVDLNWKFANKLSAGVSASQVRFPNGHIKSNQLGLTLAFDDEFVYAAPQAIGRLVNTNRRGGVGFDRITLVAGSYRPDSGVRDLAGNTYANTIGYTGFRMEQQLDRHWFWGIESGAATKGGADGYAEILGVLGAEYPVASERLKLGARLALGMGGGGKLSVGGGALAKAGLYAKAQLSEDIYVALEGGLVQAPNGGFKARYGTVQLGMDLDYPSFQTAQRTIRGTEWSASAQHYLGAARYNGSRRSLDTMGLKIDRAISGPAYFSAQAHSAYAGEAGGFSVGLIGLGLRSARTSSGLSAGLEVLAGAAGGGGVSTQGGAVAQLMPYASLDLNQAASVKLGLGRVRSIKGALNSTVLDMSLSFPFGVPGK